MRKHAEDFNSPNCNGFEIKRVGAFQFVKLSQFRAGIYKLRSRDKKVKFITNIL